MKLQVSVKRTAMGRTPSDHMGECQGCGRRQMLPGGVLSNHGYTVQWQMFVGTCPGSGRRPYEESCEYCKQCIERAKEQVVQLEKQFKVVEAEPLANPIKGVSVNGKDSRGLHKEIRLSEAELFYDPEYVDSWGRKGAVFVRATDGKVYYKDPAINESHANRVMQEIFEKTHKRNIYKITSQIANVQKYIQWQEKRVADWKPVDPVKIERDPQNQALNRLELGLLKTIADVCKRKGPGGTYGINDRSKYYVKNTVTYNRVVKLAERGYVTKVDSGRNDDGSFITVRMSEKGLETLV